MSNHDTQILDGLRRGEQDALVALLQDKHRVLLAFIQKRIGSQLQRKIEPEDVLQEASIEALRSLEKIEFGDRDPLNWLFTICERKIIDAHRKFFSTQKRDAGREAAIGGSGDQTGAGLGNLLAASMTTPSQAFSRDQKQLAMLAALDTLPDEQREALRLRYLVGLSTKDIAEKLGKSDGAVRVMLSRGISKLQTMLVDAE